MSNTLIQSSPLQHQSQPNNIWPTPPFAGPFQIFWPNSPAQLLLPSSSPLSPLNLPPASPSPFFSPASPTTFRPPTSASTAFLFPHFPLDPASLAAISVLDDPRRHQFRFLSVAGDSPFSADAATHRPDHGLLPVLVRFSIQHLPSSFSPDADAADSPSSITAQPLPSPFSHSLSPPYIQPLPTAHRLPIVSALDRSPLRAVHKLIPIYTIRRQSVALFSAAASAST